MLYRVTLFSWLVQKHPNTNKVIKACTVMVKMMATPDKEIPIYTQFSVDINFHTEQAGQCPQQLPPS